MISAFAWSAGTQPGPDTRQGAPEDIAFADVLGALMRGQVGRLMPADRAPTHSSTYGMLDALNLPRIQNDGILEPK